MKHGLGKEIEEARSQFIEEVAKAQSSELLLQIKEKYFSRKRGQVTRLYSLLKDVPPDQKPEAGKSINDLRCFIEERLAQAEAALGKDRKQRIDYTRPHSPLPLGHFHPLSYVRVGIEDIFVQMGYEIADGPEMESEANNFDALNFPFEHPARDEQDTFFIADFPGMILRTHTSPVQIRYMLGHTPPIQIIAPGKTFRKDNPDATHSPCFHQVEGLLVDHGITFSHLKGTLEHFIHLYFGPDVRTRFRPSFFPFTEPSAEVDISCFACPGSDPECRVCKGKGWLEILGSGMVHPQVLRNCGIDPQAYSGFAFGMGIERVAMIKYGIPDLRLLYDNDMRILEQLG